MKVSTQWACAAWGIQRRRQLLRTRWERSSRPSSRFFLKSFDTKNISDISQMWCLYKEVGGYYAEGLRVPDDITLLWADDNWGNAQRLPLSNETDRVSGAG